MSLPVRGAWIEMEMIDNMKGKKLRSLPVRGAWIEMEALAKIFLLLASVAPRAGSVD